MSIGLCAVYKPWLRPKTLYSIIIIIIIIDAYDGNKKLNKNIIINH